MLIPHSNSSVDERFVFTGGNSAKVVSGGYRVQEFDEWEVTSGPQVLQVYAGVDGDLTPQVIGAPTTIYAVNARQCRTSTYAVTSSRRP